MTKIWLLYSIFPDREKAFSAARALLDESLIACANVQDGVTSLYRWQGDIRQDSETALIAKTRREKVEAATARLKELHPYELPCIIAWPAHKGFAPFLRWVEKETN
ncbi:MAG: divalent-cation tolerance protein CutA [Pseudomonadota bacterium]|nr:divalent-cation tolerance protein CutA [Pseudomonadota bacterium]MDE3038613.1 divalent-cation tolerance protein CutA [Pseudomonadota bacterium]